MTRFSQKLDASRILTGHASIATTSIYTHLAVEDDGRVGELFE